VVAEAFRMVGPTSKEIYVFPQIFRILELILNFNVPGSLVPETRIKKNFYTLDTINYTE
jgi:hypothetical protein